MTPDKEFRVYVTNDKFETLPLKKLSGSAHFSPEERFHDDPHTRYRRLVPRGPLVGDGLGD